MYFLIAFYATYVIEMSQNKASRHICESFGLSATNIDIRKSCIKSDCEIRMSFKSENVLLQI